MDSFLHVLGMRRPSLRPLLAVPRTGTKARWLKVVGLLILCCICLSTMHLSHTEDTEAVTLGSFNQTITIGGLILSDKEYLATRIGRPKESCDSIKERADKLPAIEYLHPADTSADIILAGWEDEWIAHGTIPNGTAIEPYKLDFIYTYVRSDEDFLEMKRPYDAQNQRQNDTKWQVTQASRFRSWDELRYSIRGTMKNAASWVSRINIVAKDFDSHDEENNMTTHIIQQPLWMNETILQDESKILIIPETSIIENGECGPTFNSVSIESSFGNVPLTTDHFIGISDDMLLGKEVAVTDFVSPMFGMSFSWYQGIWTVNEIKNPNLGDGELGEAHVLKHTSYMLNGRFGRRLRALQLHQAKVMNQKILNEAMATFPSAALKTPLSRFRDDSHQLYAWYLHMHFTMEMHREALLWSIAMRTDSDGDGELQPAERAKLVEEIESGIANMERRQGMPMFPLMQEKLRQAGQAEFKIQRLMHTSLDGPRQIKDLGAASCAASFSIEKCFGAEFTNDTTSLSADQLFLKMTDPSKSVVCSDCLIKYLLNNADIGLSPLLPAKESKYRERAIKAIHKYQYTETTPDNTFLMVTNERDARALLGYVHKIPGLLCINDDVLSKSPQILDQVATGFHNFYERLFPEPSIFENHVPTAPESETESKPEAEPAKTAPQPEGRQDRRAGFRQLAKALSDDNKS